MPASTFLPWINTDAYTVYGWMCASTSVDVYAHIHIPGNGIYTQLVRQC
jgi:hypothetical protein